MKRINQGLFVILTVILALLYYRNTKSVDTLVKSEPAKVKTLTNTNLKEVTLTAKAAKRLGIETVPVRQERIMHSGRGQKVIPYSSVIYDLQGETWTYTNPEPLSFIRQAITIDYIEKDTVYLSDGPPADTLVVTVGAAELYGIETGVGK